MKKTFNVCTVLLGIGLLGLLIHQIGYRELIHEMAQLGWGLVPLVLIEGVADIFHTVGWRYCLSGPHRKFSFIRLFRINLAGTSINYLTPTATVGGEIAKGVLLSQKEGGTEAASGVIIGKLSQALAQILLVSAGSILTLWGVKMPPGAWPAMLVSSAILLSGVIGFLLVQKNGKLGAVVRWVVARKIGGARLANAAHQITEVDRALQAFYRERPMDLPLSIMWRMVAYGMGIIQSWYFFYLVTGESHLRAAAGIWFLGTWFDLLSFAIPLGIGVQEATRVIAFNALGFQSVMGLAYGIMLRLEQIFWAGVGLLNYVAFLTEKNTGNPVPVVQSAVDGRAFPLREVEEEEC